MLMILSKVLLQWMTELIMQKLNRKVDGVLINEIQNHQDGVIKRKQMVQTELKYIVDLFQKLKNY